MIEVNPPVSCTPASTTGWQSVDLSATLPAGASGAYIRMRNTSASGVFMGARHPSVTDNLYNVVGASAYQHRLAGVNAARQIQLFRNDGGATYEIVGYSGDEYRPLTTTLFLTVTAATTWETVSVASATGTDTAVGVVLLMGGSFVNGLGGARHPDSTDTFIAGNSAPGFIGPAADWFCGVNASEQLQIFLLNTSRSVPVTGYFVSGFTWNVNAINRGPAAAGSYQTLTTFPSGNTHGMYMFRGEDNAMLRRVGDTFNALAVYDYQEWIVPGDGSRQVEAQVANVATDVFELGALATSTVTLPPTIDAPETIAQGDAVAATVTNAPAATRSVDLLYGAVTIGQTVAGADGSATFTASFERAAPSTSIPRGVTATARITNTANGRTATDTFTTASPSGQAHITLIAVNTTAANRISAAVDVVVGDQVQYRGQGGGALPAGFLYYPDGTFGFSVGAAVVPFEYRIFDSTDNTLGDWAAISPLADAPVGVLATIVRRGPG